MLNKFIWTFFVLLISLGAIFGQSFENNRQIRSGNKAFQQGDTLTAIQKYDEALIHDSKDYRASFNKAVVSKSMGNLDEAMSLYENISKQDIAKEERAAAFYNMGNIAFEKQELEKSLDHFKNCLRLTPEDQDARYNYFLVKKMLEQQQEQQQQNQDQNQENQDQQNEEQDQENQEQQNRQDQQENNQEENSDQQEENQENQEENGQEEQEQQGDKNQGEEGEEENRESQQNQEGREQEKGEQEGQVIQLSKEEAERLLEALENQEKEIQAKILRKKPKKSNKKPEKDW